MNRAISNCHSGRLPEFNSPSEALRAVQAVALANVIGVLLPDAVAELEGDEVGDISRLAGALVAPAVQMQAGVIYA